MVLFLLRLLTKSRVNFSLVTTTTFLLGSVFITLFPMACIRCVFPRPTPPYIISGLKELCPRLLATELEAFLANSLLEPSMKFLNLY